MRRPFQGTRGVEKACGRQFYELTDQVRAIFRRLLPQAVWNRIKYLTITKALEDIVRNPQDWLTLHFDKMFKLRPYTACRAGSSSAEWQGRTTNPKTAILTSVAWRFCSRLGFWLKVSGFRVEFLGLVEGWGLQIGIWNVQRCVQPQRLHFVPRISHPKSPPLTLKFKPASLNLEPYTLNLRL